MVTLGRRKSDYSGVCPYDDPDQPTIDAAKEVFELLKKRDGTLWPQLVEESGQLIVKSGRLVFSPSPTAIRLASSFVSSLAGRSLAGLLS